MDRVHIAPVNAGFTEFTIAGDLPSGIYSSLLVGLNRFIDGPRDRYHLRYT